MKLPGKFDLRVGIILASLALPNAIVWAQIQAPPTVQGTFVADPAVPTIISPTQNTSQLFVLNQDLSVRSLSDLNSGFNASCTPVVGLSVTGSTGLRTLANDNRHLYLTALNSAGSNLAVTGMTPLAGPATCGAAPAVNTSGGVPSSTLTAADWAHNRLLVVNARNGIGADTITTFNTGNVEGPSPVLTQAGQATLDTNAQYTSVVADADGDFALTAVTELRTATSPGNLWV